MDEIRLRRACNSGSQAGSEPVGNSESLCITATKKGEPQPAFFDGLLQARIHFIRKVKTASGKFIEQFLPISSATIYRLHPNSSSLRFYAIQCCCGSHIPAINNGVASHPQRAERHHDQRKEHAHGDAQAADEMGAVHARQYSRPAIATAQGLEWRLSIAANLRHPNASASVHGADSSSQRRIRVNGIGIRAMAILVCARQSLQILPANRILLRALSLSASD